MLTPHAEADNVHRDKKQQIQQYFPEQSINIGQIRITERIIHPKHIAHQLSLRRKDHTQHSGDKYRKAKE
ncbi:hypothetical protein D3C80_1549540 [compost metagenome]